MKENKKKEPWRIVAAILSIAFIAFMWVENDVISIYTTMPQEQVLPLIVTTIVVSLLKIGAIAGVLLLLNGLSVR